jgi:hypothetical protein
MEKVGKEGETKTCVSSASSNWKKSSKGTSFKEVVITRSFSYSCLAPAMEGVSVAETAVVLAGAVVVMVVGGVAVAIDGAVVVVVAVVVVLLAVLAVERGACCWVAPP